MDLGHYNFYIILFACFLLDLLPLCKLIKVFKNMVSNKFRIHQIKL